MQDWLQTFASYSPSVQGGWYIKTNDKSLVVRRYSVLPFTFSPNTLQVSILSAGTFFGALFAFPMGDMVGRKWGIVASCCIFTCGVGMQLDTHWVTFVVGRGKCLQQSNHPVFSPIVAVVAGVGVGLVSCLVPMYQSECAPKAIRGLIVGLYQLAITIGALLAAIVLNSTKNNPNHSSWRVGGQSPFVSHIY